MLVTSRTEKNLYRLSLIFPKAGNEGEQETEDFQTSGEHEQRRPNQLDIAEHVPRTECADGVTNGRTYVADGGEGKTNGVQGRKSAEHEEENGKDDEKHVEAEEDEQGATHAGRDETVLNAKGNHGMRVEHLPQFAANHLPNHQNAHTLDAARSGAGAGADKGAKQQHNPRHGMPQHEVLIGEARRGLNRSDGEETAAQCVLKGKMMHKKQGGADGEGGRKIEAKIETQLLVAEHVFHTALDEEQIGQREIHAGEQHEHRGDPLKQRRLIVRNGGGVRGETTGGNGGESVIDSIAERRSTEEIGGGTTNRQKEIDRKEPAGSGGDAGMEFPRAKSGAFRGEEFQVAAADVRKHGDGEEDDSHAANPVGETAPKEQALGERVNLGQTRGAGGGETGHGLKNGGCKARRRTAEQEGQRTDEREGDPGERDDEIAIAAAETVLGTATQMAKQKTEQRRNTHGNTKGEQMCAVTGIGNAYAETKQEHAGLQKEQHADGF